MPNKILIVFLTLISLASCQNPTNPTEIADGPCAAHPKQETCLDIVASRFSGIQGQFIDPGSSHDMYLVSFDKSEHAVFELPGCSIHTNSLACNIPSSTGEKLFEFSRASNHPSQRFLESLGETLIEQDENMFVASIRSENVENSLNFSISNDPCSHMVSESEEVGNRLQTCTFSALSRLEAALTAQLVENDYTHVIVFSTGWNTLPDQSVIRYGTFLDGMKRAAVEQEIEFEPLLVGITWPSKWNIPVLSFVNKARDADELGQLWVNYVINQSVSQAMESAGNDKSLLTVIGHSFGARMVATASLGSGPINRLDVELLS